MKTQKELITEFKKYLEPYLSFSNEMTDVEKLNNITFDTTLESLGMDSLDVVELFMTLEEDLGLTIENEDAEKITTVGEAIVFYYGRGKF